MGVLTGCCTTGCVGFRSGARDAGRADEAERVDEADEDRFRRAMEEGRKRRRSNKINRSQLRERNFLVSIGMRKIKKFATRFLCFVLLWIIFYFIRQQQG